MLLLAFAPLLAFIAIAIRATGPGPVFYRQERGGLGLRPFRIFKFRSMRHEPETAEEVRQCRQRDPRVTPLGRILRASSADELPQLLNVLRGDMSLVGPRPHAVAHDRLYSAKVRGYVRRFNARPGITGLAQVSGLRGETETPALMQMRVDADLVYIATASLAGDFIILARTATHLLFDRNVY